MLNTLNLVTVLLDSHSTDISSSTMNRDLFQLSLSPAISVLGVAKANDLVLLPANIEATISVTPIVHTTEKDVRCKPSRDMVRFFSLSLSGGV